MANFDEITGLNATCDGTDEHMPFRIRKGDGSWSFSTAEEAAYPTLLCNRVSDIVIKKLLSKGYQPRAELATDNFLDSKQLKQLTRAVAGKFVRGRKLLPLISEFEEAQTLSLPSPVLNSKIELNNKTGKILRVGTGVQNGHEDFKICAVGIYRTPKSFAEHASTLKHPVDMPTTISEVIAKNIVWNLESTAAQIASFQLQAIKLFRKLAEQLAPRDAELKSKVPQHAKSIVSDKTWRSSSTISTF